MVFTATSAVILTNDAITTSNNLKLQQEITNCEVKIRAATVLFQYRLIYNATVIGNPIGDPNVDTNLANPLQVEFRDLLTTAGYSLGFDTKTGYWTISWETSSIEADVSVYLVRTSVDNDLASNVDTVIALIKAYFTDLIPTHTSRVVYSGYGAVETNIGLFTCVISPAGTGLEAGLLTALIASPYGFDGGNTDVFRIA